MRNRHLKTTFTILAVLAPLAFATGAHADPTGTLSFSGQLASGATPTPGSAQSFTVSGVLSDPEYLCVYVDPTGQGCADDPADEAVLPVTACVACPYCGDDEVTLAAGGVLHDRADYRDPNWGKPGAYATGDVATCPGSGTPIPSGVRVRP